MVGVVMVGVVVVVVVVVVVAVVVLEAFCGKRNVSKEWKSASTETRRIQRMKNCLNRDSTRNSIRWTPT